MVFPANWGTSGLEINTVVILILQTIIPKPSLAAAYSPNHRKSRANSCKKSFRPASRYRLRPPVYQKKCSSSATQQIREILRFVRPIRRRTMVQHLRSLNFTGEFSGCSVIIKVLHLVQGSIWSGPWASRNSRLR